MLEKYFLKIELEEFLETKKIKKLELIKGFSAEELENLLFNNKNNDEQLIDYVICNFDLNKASFLKLEVKLPSFLGFFEKINEEYPNIEIKNAKEFMLNKIKNDFESDGIFSNYFTKSYHKKSLYNLIENKYSNVEVYVLIKKNVELDK